MNMNIPNLFTLSRILLIPILVIVFYLPLSWSHSVCTAIFLLAAATDWLDGYLARTLRQTSSFGAFLDPVADKLIVAVALVLLVGQPHLQGLAVPAAIIIGREIAISALREWMAELGKRAHVAVSYVGKVKTVVQMTAVSVLLFYKPNDPLWIGVLGYVLLYLAALLTIYSMVIYIKAAWQDLLKA